MKVVKRYKPPVTITKSWKCNAQHGDYSEHCHVAYLKVLKRVVHPKSSHIRKNR